MIILQEVDMPLRDKQANVRQLAHAESGLHMTRAPGFPWVLYNSNNYYLKTLGWNEAQACAEFEQYVKEHTA